MANRAPCIWFHFSSGETWMDWFYMSIWNTSEAECNQSVFAALRRELGHAYMGHHSDSCQWRLKFLMHVMHGNHTFQGSYWPRSASVPTHRMKARGRRGCQEEVIHQVAPLVLYLLPALYALKILCSLLPPGTNLPLWSLF